MLNSPNDIILAFRADCDLFENIELSQSLSRGICHELISDHQKVPNLGPRHAVYAFTLKNSTDAILGAARALKVGRVSPSANPRFKHQHYSCSAANSTLAKSIRQFRMLWSHIGYDPNLEVGQWIRENTDRDHFYVPNQTVAQLLEVYLRAKVGSVFEGAASLHL